MIKLAAVGRNGQPVVVLGLSHENLARLLADEPIKVHMEDLDLPPMTVILFAGKDEDEMVEQMRPLISERTEFRLPGQ
jgi:hypothetical protein